MTKPPDPATKAEFKKRVRRWAEKLDVDVTWLGIRPMRTKWASCSANGHLNFNADLLELEQSLWDYVIVHELLHFSVPNHGKLWKSLMRAHLGDWETHAARLKRVGLSRSRE
jgi:predicted metal-dependent hydrolase